MAFPGPDSGSPNGGDGGAYPGPGGAGTGYGPPSFVYQIPKLITAHAVLMTSAFLFFYPLGALVTRIPLPFHFLKAHIPIQFLALVLSICGVGVGVKLADYTHISLSNHHTAIGLVVVFTLLGLQPAAGWLQHRYYKQTGRRGVLGSWHIWLGRTMIILGIVNGGLGLKLAGDTHKSRTTAYIAMAAVVGTLYGLALVFDVFRQRSLRNITGFPGEKMEMRKGSGASSIDENWRDYRLPDYMPGQSHASGRGGSKYMNTWA